MVQTKKAKSLRGRIDFVVITIREDEFEAVLHRFKPTMPVYGGKQYYEYAKLRRADGTVVRVAIMRAFDQGQSVAQLVTHDAITDLAPKWIVLTGIAGAVPDSEFTLGDVFLANSYFDFSVTAEIEDKKPQLRTAGGTMHPAVLRLLAHLPAWRDRLDTWNDPSRTGGAKPAVEIPNDVRERCYYGDEETRREIVTILQGHFMGPGKPRLPIYRIGAVATSNSLLKDSKLLSQWKLAARHITHIEMEAGGACLAASHAEPPIPLLSVRGISDVVGFKRADAWTRFACEVAASFLYALITEMPASAFGMIAKPGAVWIALARTPATTRRFAGAFMDNVGDIVTRVMGLLRTGTDVPPTLEALRKGFAKPSAHLVVRIVALGERIPRPELGDLEDRFSSQSGKVLCVLGGAGSGKTALLALMAQNAATQGIATFAVKADLLADVRPFEDWGLRELHKDISAIDAIKVVASRERVLVIVDQLDALSSIVAVSSDLFNTVVEFIRECSTLPKVSVVCSCREFDYHHDARFEELEADEIQLSLPPWDEVSKQLTSNGIAGSEHWPQQFREVLRTPQHLRIFLDRYREIGSVDPRTSYALMLDDLWTRKVETETERKLLHSMTEYLMEHEALWAPAAVFGQFSSAIKSLKSKGLLESQGHRIGFKHQTLLEHAKAQFFTTSGSSLSKYVLERQDTLQVRPTVWAVLHYLRDAVPDKYRTEIEALFAGQPRLHMRYLLIEFLGQIGSPEEFEKVLLAERLTDADDQNRVLLSIRGNPAWFDAFAAAYFPAIMQREAQSQWPMIGVINAAWDHAHDTCVELVQTHWFPDPLKDELTVSALRETDKWESKEFRMACEVVKRSTPTEHRIWWAEHLVSIISAAQPDFAPELFVATMETIASRGEGFLHSPLDSTRDWYDLPEVAKAAPAAFMRASWGWFAEMCYQFHGGCYSTVLYRYDGRSLALDDEGLRPASPITTAFVTAIESLAALELATFVEITKESWKSENLVVHRLIQRGLAIVAPVMPDKCLEYLASDRRRLWVGSRESHGQSDSVKLIGELAPALDSIGRSKLESLITGYSQYREGQELCSDQFTWDREARLRLLNAIPTAVRSEAVSELIATESSALPGWDRVIPEPRVGFVREIPPMDRATMATASEDDIVRAIIDAPKVSRTQREWREIEGGWEEPGDAITAAHELAELAKDDPQKVVSIIKALVANGREDVASAAFSGLSESSLGDDDVFSLARFMIAANIGHGYLRHHVAYSVYRRSKLPNGLPDDICDAIAGWLRDLAERPNETEEDPEKLEIQDDGNAVLWGNAGTSSFRTIDDDDYLFAAVSEGYMRRDSPREVDWLALLERLIAGNIPERTWVEFCSELRWIRAITGDRARGAKAVAALFNRYPSILRRREGTLLLARIADLLPPEQLRTHLEVLRAETVPVFRQAYGELLILIAFRDVNHGWARDILQDELGRTAIAAQFDDAIAAGIAHGASNLWDEPPLRPECGRTLSRLIPVATERIGGAISSVFQTNQNFIADGTTEQLLLSLADNPGPLTNIPIVDLVPHLVSLLPHQRGVILSLCNAIMASRTDWRELYEAGPQLVKISMTLQRFSDTRAGALGFFEQLLRRGLDDAFGVLRDIDIQPSDKPILPRRERRRRMRRK